jgi:hypothetical protein
MRRQFDPIIVECLNLQNERCDSNRDEDHAAFTEEKYHRWLILWRGHLEGRNIQSVSLERADAIISLGNYLACMTDRHKEAIGYLNILLSHPDVGSLDPGSIIHHRRCLIWSLLHVGDQKRVVEIGQSMLNMERACDRRIARDSLRTCLQVYFGNLDAAQQKQMASPQLTDFVWSLVLLYKRRPVRRQLPGRATYEQLVNILYMTYPPRERACYRQETTCVASN